MKIKAEDILLFAIVSSLLLPPLPPLGGLSLRIDDFLLLGIAPFLCFKTLKIRKKSPLWLFLLFILSAIVSTLVGYTYRNVPSSYRDFNEFVRMLKFVPAILLVSSFEMEHFWRKYDKIMYYGALFIILISFLEFLNIGGIASMLGAIYSDADHTANMIGPTRRIVITGSDPNIGAFIAMYFYCYCYLQVLIHKKYGRLIVLGLLLLCIFLTSSRTAFLSSILISLYPLFLNTNLTFFRKIIFVIFLIFGFVSTLVFSDLSYLINGMDQLSSGDNASLNIRFLMWEENLEYAKESMWLGWGPAKEIHESIVDGEYIFLLVRYGIIGVSLFLFFLFWIAKQVCRFTDLYSRYLIIITVIGLICMSTNNFFSGYQLFLNYIVIASLLLVNCEKLKNT